MALLDALLKKLRYTAAAVTDIGTAANEKGANINLDTTPLARWAKLIRDNIKSGGTAGRTAGVEVTVKVVRPRTIYIDRDYRLPSFEPPFVNEDRVSVSGTWRFNEALTNPSGLFVGSGRTNFRSNNTNFIGLSHAYAQSDTEHASATKLGYYANETSVVDAYVWSNLDNPLGSTGWTNEAYRTIEFTGEFPTMDAALYEWFMSNATKIK